MAFHPDITRKDTVSLALDTANAAVRIASKQLTGNAGTVEIPNADGTSTIMGVGAGETGVAPWVGDKTPPGKPLGITAESHNGAIWVSWDGTLDGGIPADFDHVRFTAVDGSQKVDMGQLKSAGKVTAAELTAGHTVTITAIAYDDAHTADGSSTPNASVASDPVTVVVQSAVDASAIQKAQDDAQDALDKVGRVSNTATSAQTTANLALENAPELIINGGFETGDATGWGIDATYQVVDDMASAHSGRYYLNAGPATEIAQPIAAPVIPGHIYRFSGWYRRPSTNSSIFGGIRFQKSSDGKTYDDWQSTNFDTSKRDDWTYFSLDAQIPSDGSIKYARYRLAFIYMDGVVQHFDDLSFKDITEVKAAQDAAKTAQTTADGKNKIFSSASEPAHTGLVPGDLWFQLNSSNHVTGIQTWNGSRFVDYLVVANEILVAGSVGTTQIKNGAITTDLLTSNAVTAIKIAAQTITGDKLNVGSVASAIITSGLFKTADSGARVVIDSTGIKAYDASGNVTFQVDSATGKAMMVGGMATGVSGQNRAVVDYDNKNQQGEFMIIGSDDGPIFSIIGHNEPASRIAYMMVANPKGVSPDISISNTGAVSGETSIELNADEVSLNKHDLTSKRRCVFNWETDWTGVSNVGSGYLEGTFNFSMSRGWYLVEAYVRTNGVGKEYHLDMQAYRTNGTLMDAWTMNLPMPTTGIGNMVCSQMVYVDDQSVDLAARLYSRDYGSRPELLAGNDSKHSLYYPKRELSRYFRIFAM